MTSNRGCECRKVQVRKVRASQAGCRITSGGGDSKDSATEIYRQNIKGGVCGALEDTGQSAYKGIGPYVVMASTSTRAAFRSKFHQRRRDAPTNHCRYRIALRLCQCRQLNSPSHPMHGRHRCLPVWLPGKE